MWSENTAAKRRGPCSGRSPSRRRRTTESSTSHTRRRSRSRWAEHKRAGSLTGIAGPLAFLDRIQSLVSGPASLMNWSKALPGSRGRVLPAAPGGPSPAPRGVRAMSVQVVGAAQKAANEIIDTIAHAQSLGDEQCPLNPLPKVISAWAGLILFGRERQSMLIKLAEPLLAGLRKEGGVRMAGYRASC